MCTSLTLILDLAEVSRKAQFQLRARFCPWSFPTTRSSSKSHLLPTRIMGTFTHIMAVYINATAQVNTKPWIFCLVGLQFAGTSSILIPMFSTTISICDIGKIILLLKKRGLFLIAMCITLYKHFYGCTKMYHNFVISIWFQQKVDQNGKAARLHHFWNFENEKLFFEAMVLFHVNLMYSGEKKSSHHRCPWPWGSALGGPVGHWT